MYKDGKQYDKFILNGKIYDKFYLNNKIYGEDFHTELLPLIFTNTFSDLKVLKTSVNTYTINKNADFYKQTLVSPVVKYLDKTNGNDLNNGDSELTAYKTLDKLLSANYDRAIIKQGNYRTFNKDLLLSKGLEYIGIGDINITLGVLGDIAAVSGWTYDSASGIYAYTFDRPISNIFNTSTKTALTRVNSSDTVKITNNSWWQNSANRLYIKINSGDSPSDFIAMITENTANYTGNKNFYFENINFLGGLATNNGTSTENLFIMKNCKVQFAKSSNGLSAWGKTFTVLENCEANYNFLDGFNYHSLPLDSLSTTFNPKFIEVNCKAFNNGYSNTGSQINNGSTAHELTIGIRFNSEYNTSTGIVLHDIGNSQTLNVNCIVKNSISSNPLMNSSVRSGNTTGTHNTKMYFIDGIISNIPQDFDIGNPSSYIYLRYISSSTINTNIQEF